MSETSSDVKTRVETRTDITPPKLFKVIYLNDEVTTVEFVVTSLMDIFDHDYDEAGKITKAVHEDGSAIVAVLPFEIAEHKGGEVVLLARANNFPLMVKIEPEA